VVVDIIPTREMWRRMDAELGRRYWHWLFHLQPDLPERLAGADVAGYVGYFLERWTHNRHAFTAADVDEYVRAFSRPGALRAGFEDYRASFPLDAEHDDADAAAGRVLSMPVLAMWGAEGLLGMLPTEEIWRAYAPDLRVAAIPACGHFVPEEQPQAVLEQLRAFLG
jgi:pimeloyl-ACP methyl ester carboxylesterase